MKPLKFMAAILDRFVWVVGVMTLYAYAEEHWPKGFVVGACLLIGSFVAAYFWKFFWLPFRAGFRGH